MMKSKKFHNKRPIIMANWKLNGGVDLICSSVASLINQPFAAEIVICPPYLYLRDMLNFLQHSQINVGSQNVSKFKSGAYTGETSAQMLKEAGCQYCLVGHSERRETFGENNASCQLKIERALQSGLTPVLCIGESQKEYECDLTEQVLTRQLTESLENIDLSQQSICIAYEPVWAIGTGKSANAQVAQKVHYFIRQQLKAMYSEQTAQNTRIMYGGSVNKNNAETMLEQPDIDGLLVGGASLDPAHFSEICNYAKVV
ncbi:triose-phosphate isomerase [Catenovulum adriaticum]